MEQLEKYESIACAVRSGTTEPNGQIFKTNP